MNRIYEIISKNLRSQRSKNGWTLRDLAEGSLISAATISRLENDASTITVAQYLALSAAVGGPLCSDLIIEEPELSAVRKTKLAAINYANKIAINQVMGSPTVPLPMLVNFLSEEPK